MLVKPPENGSLKGTCLKLVDFGIAKQIPDDQERILCDTSGTPYYLAPETLKQELLGCPVDIWASGVILYVLLVGSLPFWMGEKGKGEMLLKIVKGEYTMEESDWETVSDGAKQLVSQMLDIDQDARITADEALQNKWIQNTTRVSTLEKRGTLFRLRAFNAKRKLRSAIFAIIAHRRLKSATPPCSRRSKKCENGIESSGDELGSESESSVVDEDVTDGPKVAGKARHPSDSRKCSNACREPSQLLLDSPLLVRQSSDSSESGVFVSPVTDRPTCDFKAAVVSDVLLRPPMSPKKRHESQNKRQSIKETIKELHL
jgi:serine/threonine protein kinase